MNREVICFDAVAPARERGLKSLPIDSDADSCKVAPARERGLKCQAFMLQRYYEIGRSREGAWIEIFPLIFSRRE